MDQCKISCNLVAPKLQNVQFNPMVTNTPKDSHKWQLITCSCKKNGYKFG
jgi:hypothetical protein